ncbi:MAG: metallophosphoesterase, partial [Ferruginibacter sp.]
MRSPSGLAIIITLMLLVDFYIFQGLKTVSNPVSAKAKIIIYSIFWAFSLLSIIGLIVFVNTDAQFMGKKTRTYLFAIIMGLFLAKLCALVFLVIDDLRRAIQWLASRIFFRDTEAADFVGDKISRSAFLSWMGFAAGGTLFSNMLYGFSNKYKYQVKKIKLSFSNLPINFKGFKIVQISDIH